MVFPFDTMLCSSLGDENSDADHIKCPCKFTNPGLKSEQPTVIKNILKIFYSYFLL